MLCEKHFILPDNNINIFNNNKQISNWNTTP